MGNPTLPYLTSAYPWVTLPYPWVGCKKVVPYPNPRQAYVVYTDEATANSNKYKDDGNESRAIGDVTDNVAR